VGGRREENERFDNQEVAVSKIIVNSQGNLKVI
jgi:hypothetical protein